MMFIAFTLSVAFLYYRPMSGTPYYKPVQDWLHHPSGHLGAVLSQVHLLRRLTAALRDALPEPLASHCLAANLDNDTLVVGCSSSAWAAKLRYQLPALLARLRNHAGLAALSQIRIRVQPSREERPRIPLRRARLSPRSADILSTLAEGTADPALKAALQRLSRHALAIKKP
jgi:hypothetical protein